VEEGLKKGRFRYGSEVRVSKKEAGGIGGVGWRSGEKRGGGKGQGRGRISKGRRNERRKEKRE